MLKDQKQPDRFELRQQQIDDSAEFGKVFTDPAGETHSYAAYAPTALEAQEQMELELTGYSLREMIRRRLADRIDQVGILERREGHGIDVWLEHLTTRLRNARQKGQFGVRLDSGKPIVYWDDKAGLSRLCPDDAREEAMRLRRRVLPTLEALQAEGHQLHYAVLTTPNAPAGELRAEMSSIFLRLRRLIKAKDADGHRLFPQIKGALCVLEAPLGCARDWNVHLNVIFVTKGFFDWKALRKQWHWDVHMRLLPKGAGAIGAALTELIKYAVAATVSKSAEHLAREGRAPPPPMLEWTPAELREWLYAMKGFRRTRSYGALYGLAKPEPEEVGPVVWLGSIAFQRGRYVCSVPLLSSIPEDKSSGRSGADRWLALIRALKPAGVAGAGTLGDSIPRDALHSSLEQLKKS